MHASIRALAALCLIAGVCGCGGSRLEEVRERGVLVCGIWPDVAGFAEARPGGGYAGFDVDICRAMAAAIFGTPDRVRFAEVESVDAFLASEEVDVVSRRLSWSLEREGHGLLFGPVTFYDGQGFLVPAKLGVKTAADLGGKRVCVVPGNINQFNLNAFVAARNLTVERVTLRAVADVEGAFADGRCDAFTADVSMLGAIRSTMRARHAFEILPEWISKEPLAQVVRQGDDRFFTILRWTVFAMIAAEELGVTSQNVDEALARGDLDARRLLGVQPGNGAALGLDERWAYHVIKTVGNYGEVFDRNVGARSAVGIPRGLNSLWTDGGLLYAPLLRQ